MSQDKVWKVLIVDDDVFLREIFVDVFRESKFDVRQATDGEQGLQMAMADKPDIIITGIMMPKLSGFELLAKLKENPATKDVPVFVFSHLGKEEDRKRAFELGAKDFIVKGLVTPLEVVRRARNVLTGQVFRVAIDPEILDAKLLLQGKAGRPVLELKPDPESGEGSFRARLITE
ncbi:MAG: response regulator [Candidatus Doudnabacteria bacterium]|nr:response regulator [Candidatus Doudnabacteria bacterium]